MLLDALTVLDISPVLAAILAYGLALVFGAILGGCGIYWRRFSATLAALVLVAAPPAMLLISMLGLHSWGQRFGVGVFMLVSILNELLTGATCVSLAIILACALLVSAIRPREPVSKAVD